MLFVVGIVGLAPGLFYFTIPRGEESERSERTVENLTSRLQKLIL
jgi:hypothetical protein